jgi:hypothetical protein
LAKAAKMSRFAVTAVLLLAVAGGCSKRSENDLAAARLENEAITMDLAKARSDVEALKSELNRSKADAASARAELAKARAEADEKLGRETAEFFMTALSRDDRAQALSVCTADQAGRVYMLSRSGWSWKISSQTITPERD